MSPIRFIYFDLGNVLLNFDHGIARARIAAAVGCSEQHVHDVLFTSGLQDRYESGQVSSEEFADLLRRDLDWTASTAELLKACSDIFELNVAIVPVLAHLKAVGCRLGILSNTCDAHWQHVFAGRYAILHRLFERIILSYEVGAMKPAEEIYRAAVAAAGVSPSSIFFTDDRPENVSGARDFGIDATLFRGTQTLIDDLRQRNVRCNV